MFLSIFKYKVKRHYACKPEMDICIICINLKYFEAKTKLVSWGKKSPQTWDERPPFAYCTKSI